MTYNGLRAFKLGIKNLDTVEKNSLTSTDLSTITKVFHYLLSRQLTTDLDLVTLQSLESMFPFIDFDNVS